VSFCLCTYMFFLIRLCRVYSRVARFFLAQHTKTEKIFQMAIKYTRWPQNIPTSAITRPSKIYPNWDFRFENVPSGNLGLQSVARPEHSTTASRFLPAASSVPKAPTSRTLARPPATTVPGAPSPEIRTGVPSPSGNVKVINSFII
jgi:hypothetical protein